MTPKINARPSGVEPELRATPVTVSEASPQNTATNARGSISQSLVFPVRRAQTMIAATEQPPIKTTANPITMIA